MLVMTFIVVSLVLSLTYLQISSQKAMMETELAKRTLLMKENMIERGQGYIVNVAMQLEKDIASFNFSSAVETIQNAVVQNNSLNYGVVISADGVVYAHTLMPNLVRTTITDMSKLNVLKSQEITVLDYREHGESVS